MLRFSPEETFYDYLQSPVGKLHIFSSDKDLKAIIFNKSSMKSFNHLKFDFFDFENGHPLIEEAKLQLEEYFLGQRKKFTLPLNPEGTKFQKAVWMSLQQIPYGETSFYQEQARKLGDSKKARAVGTANSQNPISIVVPCHRVISKDGSLSGFGGGVDRKRFLLTLEGCKIKKW